MFHSARWDHDVPLDGARVGIIGTGSTAVQIVSAIVDRVAKLSLFQRTAQWVMPQENPAYSDDEQAAFRDAAGAARRLAPEPLRHVRRLRERGHRLGVARDQDDRAGVSREPREQRRAIRSCANGCARLPRRVQAAHHLARLLRRDPAPERRARHRRDRVRRTGRRAHEGRSSARARRARARDGLQGRRVHAPDGDRRAATA